MKHAQRNVRNGLSARWAVGSLAIVALVALSVSGLQGSGVDSAQASVFSESTKPKLVTDSDRNAVELGVKFSASEDITVTGIRFFKGSRNTGLHLGTLWGPDGKPLATTTFTQETRSGWQSASFATPVAVDAGATYVASYRAPKGQYSADVEYFDEAQSDGTVTFPEGAGVYTYRTGRFPTQNYQNSNYYVDVVYTTIPVIPPVDPTVPPVDPTVPPVDPTMPPVDPTVPPVDPTVPPVDPTEPPVDPTTPPVDPTTPPVDPTVPPVDPTTPPTSGDGTLPLTKEAWWGGSAYYSKFSKASAAGWTDPSFFPISVFFGKPEHAATLAGLGVNTYMGAEHDGSTLKSITDQGVSVLAQSEWTRAEVGDNASVVGWHVSDECDMGAGDCYSPQGETGQLAIQKSWTDEFRSYNDGRFLQANFGNGVLGSYWSTTTMDDHLRLVDVSSVDKYAYTSPAVQSLLPGSPFWPKGKNPASAGAYGWQQDRMETFMTPAASKPNWVFVETAKPYLTEAGAKTITGDQIEGAVWNGIIHGAAGIAYFQHNNNNTCGNYSLVDCGAALQAKVKAVDAQVKSLAPVINSQPYTWIFGPKLETSLKVKDGSAYIFAMTDGSTGARTFTLPPGVTGNVEVVGEGRTIAVANGTFTDSFASEFTHHIYRIALG